MSGPERKDTVMFCPYCGKQLNDDVKFCTNCGKPVSQFRHPEPAAETPAKPDAADMIREEASPATAPAPVEKTAPQKKRRKKKKLTWLYILVGVAAFALIVMTLTLVVLGVRKCAGKRTDSSSAPQQKITAVPSAKAKKTAKATAKATASAGKKKNTITDDDLPALAEGEAVYYGSGSCQGADSVSLRFILKADKKSIRGIKIVVKGLNAKSGGTSVKMSQASVTTDSEYQISYPGPSDTISIGKNTISKLKFSDDGTATAEVKYVFYQFNLNGAGETEIPLPAVKLSMETVDVKGGDKVAEAKAETAATLAPTSTPKPTATPVPTDTPEPTATPTPGPTKVPVLTFDRSLMKNWTDAAFSEAFGVHGWKDFKPSDPQPMYYIISATPVKDPVTGKESTGGYNKDTARHKPIDTERLMSVSGRVTASGLTLTDDPNKATFVLTLKLDYKDKIGTFKFSDGSRVNQYHPALHAVLINMVTGEELKANKKTTYATYANERVYTSMLNAAKGKQLYGDAPSLSATDFPDYWDFVLKGIDPDTVFTPKP